MSWIQPQLGVKCISRLLIICGLLLDAIVAHKEKGARGEQSTRRARQAAACKRIRLHGIIEEIDRLS